ncbi:MAG: hypothetical protein PF436_10460 [Prolixibacteraceae bacterium]|jgi:hypothetical protein|nr:hypothetical protein [Prolixibacteraceae bacterium]
MKKIILLILAVSIVSVSFSQEKQENLDDARPQPTTNGLQSSPSEYFEVPSISFDYHDISSTGTLVINGDDTGATVTLGKEFMFYGNAYTQLQATTNGYISTDLTDTGGDFSNDCPLPLWPSTGGGARIYAYHDDLVTSVYYQYFASSPIPNPKNGSTMGASVFQWVGSHWVGSAGVDVQAYLYDNGDIAFFINGSGNEYGSGATFGIQNADATEGLTLSCDTSFGVDDFAFMIAGPSVVPVNYAWIAAVFMFIGLSVLIRKRFLRI